MSKSCPHCGLSMNEDQQICPECDALFHRNDPPAPTVMPPPTLPAAVPALDTSEQPVPLKKAQPLSGLKLIGIAIATYILGRLVALAIGHNTSAITVLPHGIALLLMIAGIVIFILGVARLISGSGAKK